MALVAAKPTTKDTASAASKDFLMVGEPTATAKSLALLIAKQQNVLFNGSVPIRVTSEANNMPIAVSLTTESVRVLAHEISRPVRVNKSGFKEAAVINKDVASIYLNGLEGSWGLKPFGGITTAPILSGDGGIRTTQDYDAASCLWSYQVPTLRARL
jgi:hypothetical protein